MYKIVVRKDLTPNIHLFEIEAPEVARKAQAGQFVVIRVDELGERIPVTVADWNREKGTVTVVFMEVGTTTHKLADLQQGEAVLDFVGPLGVATEIEKLGTVVCVAGGFAVAVIRPIARAFKEAGNKVISIMGARTKDLVFWEEELRSVSDELIVTTDDGSYARKGMVTEPLKELLEADKSIGQVIAIGPSIMMKFSALTTKPFGVKTIVSLNPIMVDGTGMCGCCRVSVGGETKFACVDGPDFDGHLVDWDEAIMRSRMYKAEESQSMEHHACNLMGGAK